MGSGSPPRLEPHAIYAWALNEKGSSPWTCRRLQRFERSWRASASALRRLPSSRRSLSGADRRWSGTLVLNRSVSFRAVVYAAPGRCLQKQHHTDHAPRQPVRLLLRQRKTPPPQIVPQRRIRFLSKGFAHGSSIGRDQKLVDPCGPEMERSR
jgi:hypothetical protein